MSAQLFNKGDLVKIADKLPQSMCHFSAGCNAFIEYSYWEKYSRKDEKFNEDHMYRVIFENLSNTSAWYPEETMTLIKKGTEHTLLDVQIAYRDFVGERPPTPPANYWGDAKKEAMDFYKLFENAFRKTISELANQKPTKPN